MKFNERLKVADWLRSRYGDNVWGHTAAALATMYNVEEQASISSGVMNDIRMNDIRAGLNIPKPNSEAALRKRVERIEDLLDALSDGIMQHTGRLDRLEQRAANEACRCDAAQREPVRGHQNGEQVYPTTA